MQIDFHHAATYVVARSAGMSHHRANIVHGDIRPSNLVIAWEPRIDGASTSSMNPLFGSWFVGSGSERPERNARTTSIVADSSEGELPSKLLLFGRQPFGFAL